jgi:hypothetical protein
VVSCRSLSCCGSSAGSRASLEGCVGIVGTIAILPYGHLLYFHTRLHCVYFSLGNVNNYLCLERVLHCFVFLVSADVCVMRSFPTVHCVVVELCPVFLIT